MKVGIHCESEARDAQVLRLVLEGVLVREGVVDVPIDPIVSQHRGGWHSALRALHPALERFEREGVHLALVSIDHDGPPTHRAEHESSSVDGCKTCNLQQRVRLRPDGSPRMRPPVAVAVPVQALEAWLLAAREGPPPDGIEDVERRILKSRLYGVNRPGRKRFIERGLPQAEAIARDRSVLERVAAACSSFADFLRSVQRALP